jgi:hypothetical protein
MRPPTITFSTTSTPRVVPGKDRVREAIRRAAKKARRVFSATRNLVPKCLLKKVLAISFLMGHPPENNVGAKHFGVWPAAAGRTPKAAISTT